MSGPIVRKTTSKGAVLRFQQFAEGLDVQCTAGPLHFNAFIKPESDLATVVVAKSPCAYNPEDKCGAIGFSMSEEFVLLLEEFFGHVAQEMKATREQWPANQLAQAKKAIRLAEGQTLSVMESLGADLRTAEAEIERLQGELKAVRNHKRKPRPKAVPA